MTGIECLSLSVGAAELLCAVAHLATEEVGALMLLLLHRATGQIPGDHAGLANVSRLGALWFRRPGGSDATRGERVTAAIARLTGSPVVEAATARVDSAAEGLMTAAQRAQRQAAAMKRWQLVRGSGQMPLPFSPGESPGLRAVDPRPASPPGGAAAPPPLPPARASAPAAAAAAGRRLLPPRPDEAEIPEERAIDFVRGWLWQWSGFGAMPDDWTCRNVLAAAPGQSMCDIYAALNERFLKRIPPGKGWGWYVAVVRNHFRAAAAAPMHAAATA